MRRIVALWLLAAACSFGAGPAKIVLIAGKPSHPPGAHEHNAGVLLLEKWLKQNPDAQPVVVKGGWPEDESVFEGARSIVMFLDGGDRHPIMDGNRLETIGKLMDKGVGLACLHFAVQVPKENGGPQFLKWIGGYYERFYSQNPINDVELTQASPDHPISRGWKSFRLKDEWYYRMRFAPEDRRVSHILTAVFPKHAPDRDTVAWATERQDGGRGVGFTGGHYQTNWGVLDFRRLVLNAILWTAHLEIPRGGARCDIAPGDLERNLDYKPPRKK
jgi:type 1 glutamine amidotransferase